MSERGQRAWYMAGVVSWFVGAGTQGSLYPWLITVLLGESALRVGMPDPEDVALACRVPSPRSGSRGR